jgi:hypothetical protein
LEEPVANRPNWTIARMGARLRRRGRAHQPVATLQCVAKKFRYPQPRHTLKGRQVASEVDRIGLRLKLREQQAEAGDTKPVVLVEDNGLIHVSKVSRVALAVLADWLTVEGCLNIHQN